MLLELLVVLVLLMYWYASRARSYWARKGVYTVPRGDILFGHTRRLILNQIEVPQFLEELYKKYKHEKMFGIYNFCDPLLIVADIDYIKTIMVTDFSSFEDQLFCFNPKTDPLLIFNPFAAKGELWKSRRSFITAMLTNFKLKEYIPSMTKICRVMNDFINTNISQPINAFELALWYTMDNVTSIMFGYEPTAFTDSENGFRKQASAVMDKNANFAVKTNIFMPSVYKLLNLRFIAKETNDFFKELPGKLIKFRKENNVKRNDFMDHLLKLNSQLTSSGRKGMDMEEMAGHMLTVYTDATETSASFLAFLLAELANRPALQQVLRKEVTSAGKDLDDFDLEKINGLQFLEVVFNEIMRMRPLFLFYHRVCTRKTKIGNVEVDEGTKVLIPYNCIINDQDFYPEPERLEPERFLPENMSEVVKKSFIPFGDGPRRCIGMRYATLQIKLAVINLLLNFQLTASNETESNKTDTANNFLQKPSEGTLIIFKPIKESLVA